MAARNPYEVLVVKKDASEEQIRSAYRKLAKRYHPDLNPGNKESEGRVKEKAGANDILWDKDKRARFDLGEIDARGAEGPEHAYSRYRGFAEGAPGEKYEYHSAEGMAPEDLDDLFAFFGQGARGGRGGGTMRMRGGDQHYTLTVDFLAAVNGARQRLNLAPDRSLDVTIPPGVRDGQVLRLQGQGSPGINGGPPGDALIEIHVAPHPFFRREGDDIHLHLPVTLGQAVLRGQGIVPTPSGPVSMTIPANSNTGRVLRLKGRGAAAPEGRRGRAGVTLQSIVP